MDSTWIPIEKDLPEIGAEVLVTFDFNGYRYVNIAQFCSDGDFLGYDYEYLTPKGRKRKAVAWMPLVEPYREVEE